MGYILITLLTLYSPHKVFAVFISSSVLSFVSLASGHSIFIYKGKAEVNRYLILQVVRTVGNHTTLLRVKVVRFR